MSLLCKIDGSCFFVFFFTHVVKALVRLRFTEPDAPRPFMIPGGLILPSLLGVPTLIIACGVYLLVALIFSCVTQSVSLVAFFYSDWLVFVTGGTFECLVVLGYIFRAVSCVESLQFVFVCVCVLCV